MKAVRMLVIFVMLLGSMGLTAGCASRGGGGGGCSGGACGDNCACAPDRNCCDGCRQGSGCTCNR